MSGVAIRKQQSLDSSDYICSTVEIVAIGLYLTQYFLYIATIDLCFVKGRPTATIHHILLEVLFWWGDELSLPRTTTCTILGTLKLERVMKKMAEGRNSFYSPLALVYLPGLRLPV